MNRWVSVALVAGLTLHGCAPTPQGVVADAADATGGAEAILATNTLVLEGTGQTYRLGQQPNPDADLPVYELTEGNRTLVIHRLRNDIHADGMLLVYVAPFAELERTVRAMQSTARTQ